MSEDTKIFGMSANSGRWIFVILGMVVNLCLGAVYAYSVFKIQLEEMFNATAPRSFRKWVFIFSTILLQHQLKIQGEKCSSSRI